MDATTAAAARQESIDKLGELIQDVRIAMLTTVADGGRLRSRPMATQRAPFDGTLWFFTAAPSGKTEEIQDDSDVGLSYAAPDDDVYVSVSGRARLVRDRAKIDELWHADLKAWFPDGKDTDDLALLRVDVERAEYWSAPGGAVVRLVGFVKAAATGERYRGAGTDHEKLTM